jgi:hypothetical protein
MDCTPTHLLNFTGEVTYCHRSISRSQQRKRLFLKVKMQVYMHKMSTRNLPGGKGRPARKTDNLAAICEPIA